MSGSGISWAICKSAPRSRQITMPAPHYSVFYRPDALPAAQPTASKHWRHTEGNGAGSTLKGKDQQGRKQVRKKWRKKDKWGSIWYKQANKIYETEIKNWTKVTLRPGAHTVPSLTDFVVNNVYKLTYWLELTQPYLFVFYVLWCPLYSCKSRCAC